MKLKKKGLKLLSASMAAKVNGGTGGTPTDITRNTSRVTTGTNM
jgi:hypothetical protein